MKYLAYRTLAVLAASFFTGVGIVLSGDLNMLIEAFVASVVLAIINHTIRPLIGLVLSPITLLTLGLFSFVINGAMVLLASKVYVEFVIPSFIMAVVYAFALSAFNAVLHTIED